MILYSSHIFKTTIFQPNFS